MGISQYVRLGMGMGRHKDVTMGMGVTWYVNQGM